MSRPSKVTFPLVGLRVPLTRLKNVVFPAPFGPINPSFSPALTLTSTEETASRPPKYLLKPSISSIGSPLFVSRLRSPQHLRNAGHSLGHEENNGYEHGSEDKRLKGLEGPGDLGQYGEHRSAENGA